MNVLLSGLKDIDKLNKKIADSDGKAKEMAKKINDTLMGSYQELRSAVYELALAIGDDLLPALNDIVESTTDVVRGITEFYKENKVLIKTITELVAVFYGLGKVKAILDAVMGASALAGVTSFSGGLVALRGSVISLRGAMLSLSAVNPVFAGLAIVVAGATYAMNEWQDSIDKTNERTKALNTQNEQTKSLFNDLATHYDRETKQLTLTAKEQEKYKKSVDEAIKSKKEFLKTLDPQEQQDDIASTEQNIKVLELWKGKLGEAKIAQEDLTQSAKKSADTKNQLTLEEKQHQEDYLKDLDKRISKEREKDQTLEESYTSELEYLKTLKFNTEQFAEAKEKLDKYYSDQIAQRKQKELEEVNKTYKKRVEQHESSINKLQAKETDLTKKIVDLNKKLVDDLKKIDNDRLHSKEALEGKIHNLSMVGASDVAKYHDKQKQADEKLSKAKIALKNGELEEYKKYKSEYESLVTSIANTEIKKDKKVLVSKKQSANYGINALRKLGSLEDNYYNQKKAQAQEAHNQKIQQLKAELNATKAQLELEVQRLQLEKQLVEATTGQKIDIDVSGALSAIKNIDNSIDELDKQIKNPKKIDIDNAQANQSIDEVKQKYTTLKLGNKVFRIDANTTPADLGISKLINKRDGEKVSIEVNPEYEKAEREIKSAIKGFERQEVEAKVGADTSKADTKIKSFQKDAVKPLKAKVEADVKKAQSGIKKLQTLAKKPLKMKVDLNAKKAFDIIKKLKKNTHSTHTIYIREVKKKATGGLIEPIYRADGGEVNYQRKSGRISGYDASDSDDVPAMLTRGEFVVKRDAVAHYGDDFLYGLNNMQIPQKYATGGLVNIGTPQRDTRSNDNYNNYDNSSNDSYDNSYSDIQEKEPIDTSELESLLSEISSFKTKPMNKTFLGQLTRLEGEAKNTINSASHSTQENISTKTSEIESKFSEVQSKYEEFITKVSEVKEKANSENVDEIDKSGLESVVDEIQSAKNDEEMPSKIKQVYTSLENKKDVPLKYEELQEKDKKTIDKIGEGITEKIEKSKLDKDDKEVDKTFINAENKADNFDKSVTKIEKVFDKLGSQFEQFKVFKHEIDASKLSLVSKIAQAKIQQSLASQWVFGGRNGRRAKHWANQIREMQRAMKAKDASLKKAENNFKLPKFQTGGQINGLEGGKLKGYGGGDKNLALLEDGEFIIKKEAVKHHGTGFMEQINNMKSAIPKFATGGLIGYNKPEQLVQSYDSGDSSSSSYDSSNDEKADFRELNTLNSLMYNLTHRNGFSKHVETKETKNKLNSINARNNQIHTDVQLIKNGGGSELEEAKEKLANEKKQSWLKGESFDKNEKIASLEKQIKDIEDRVSVSKYNEKIKKLKVDIKKLEPLIDKENNEFLKSTNEIYKFFEVNNPRTSFEFDEQEKIYLKIKGNTTKENKDLYNQIKSLSRTEAFQILENKSIPKFQTGGHINGLKGGKLKGYGGGDKNLALLEDGEFIVKKEAVAHHGTDLLHKLNNMQVNLPKFATGGSVGGVELPKNMSSSNSSNRNDYMDINFNMPSGNSHKMQSSPDVATALAQELKRLG